MSELLSRIYNPYTDIKEDMVYQDGKIVVAKSSDVTKLIAENRRLQNETNKLPRRTAPTWNRVARIDLVTLQRIKDEHWD